MAPRRLVFHIAYFLSGAMRGIGLCLEAPLPITSDNLSYFPGPLGV
jgi:hypothetical protein